MWPANVNIALEKILANWRFFAALRPPCQMVPVLKADAYGHGLPQVTQALQLAGAQRLAVFTLEEAKIAREAGFRGEIWLLQEISPEEFSTAADLSLTSACWNWENARHLSDYACARGLRWRLHLKVDTGMSRLGVLPQEVTAAVQTMRKLPNLEFCGCFSHLAVGGQPEHPVTRKQVQIFREILPLLPPNFQENHLCATEGILNNLAPELPFARPGIGLYGYSENEAFATQLQPAMSLHCRLAAVKEVPAGAFVSYGCQQQLRRDSRLAVVPFGYADGYPRCLSGASELLIHSRRVPVLGRVCMGMIVVDVTEVPGVAVGDQAVLLGRQGEAEIRADELAAKAQTIAHEILCGLGKYPHRLWQPA